MRDTSPAQPYNDVQSLREGHLAVEIAMNNAVEVVCLIDDDRSVREALEPFLRSSGIKVKAFESSAEYLEHTRSDTAACLILDLQLPGIGGLELQRRLADDLSPPIIFISGRGDIPSTVQAMKGG